MVLKLLASDLGSLGTGHWLTGLAEALVGQSMQVWTYVWQAILGLSCHCGHPLDLARIQKKWSFTTTSYILMHT